MAEHHVVSVQIGIGARSEINYPDRGLPCLRPDGNGHTRVKLPEVFPVVELRLIIDDRRVRSGLFAWPANILRETRDDKTKTKKNYCQTLHNNSLRSFRTIKS